MIAAAAFAITGCRDIFDSIGDDTQQCVASSECPMGKVCNAGECGDPGTGGPQSPCWASRDCKEGLYCSAIGICLTAGAGDLGASCSTDGDCMSLLRCDLHGFNGTCAPAGEGEPGSTCAASTDCLAGLYCAPADGTCKPLLQAYPPFTGVVCEPPAADEPFRVYFEVPRPGAPPKDFYRLPFPNDGRVSAAGKLDMTDFPDPGPTPLGVDLGKLYVDALVNDFEGFGSLGAITFRFAGKINFDTTSGDSIKFVDITAGPTFGAGLGEDWSYSTGRNNYLCENHLTVRNRTATPLTPKHTYVVYLTTDIKSEDNAHNAAQDTDFTQVLGSVRPTDEALGNVWDKYQPFRDYLASKSIATASIAGAAVFTVQDTTGHMQRVAAAVAAAPAPVLEDVTLCDTGVTSPCDDGTLERACPAASADFYEIHGRFSVPIFQEGTAPYLTPADGGGIVEEAGVPKLQRTEKVCFALTIPKSTMPGGGWPLTVYSHGTGGSYRSFINDGVAKSIATGAVPGAVFSFDSIEHGARRGASTEDPDNLVFNPLNPRAARDNLLQGGADILQALRVSGLAPFQVTGVTGNVDFDAAKLTYYGHSQGSTSGEMAVAFSLDVKAAVFSGAGAFLTASLLDKTSPVNIKAGMQFLFGEANGKFGGDHPIMTIFQTYFERSDPANYTPLIVRQPPAGVPSKHVYMSYALGNTDTYTPRSTLQYNAQGLGAPPVVSGQLPSDDDYGIAPVSRPVKQNKAGGDGPLRTVACFMYLASGFDGHYVAAENPAAVTDWMAFLTTFLQTGTPTVQ